MGAGLVGAWIWNQVAPHYSAAAWLHATPSRFDPTAPENRTRNTTLLLELLRQPEVAELLRERDPADLPTRLEELVTIEEDPDKTSLRLRAVGRRPEEPELLVNATARVFLHEAEDRHRARLGEAVAKIEKARENLRIDPVPEPAPPPPAPDPRRVTAEKSLYQAQFERKQAQAELAVQEKRWAVVAQLTAGAADVDEQLKEDRVIQNLLQSCDQVEHQARRVEKLATAAAREPLLRKLTAEREAILNQLDRRRREVLPVVEEKIRARAREEHQSRLTQLRERVATLQELEQRLAAEIKTLDSLPRAKTPPPPAPVAEAAARQETLRKLCADKEGLEKEGPGLERVSFPGGGDTLRAVNQAERVRWTVLGAGAVWALMVLTLSLQEFYTRRVTASHEVAHGLDVDLVGTLPAVSARALGGPGKAVSTRVARQQARLSEAADALRTLLLRKAEPGPRLLVVTSAVAGEGKTSLAYQLAASLARAWRRTLLVDGNLRRPTAHLLLGGHAEPGLCEVLRGEVEAGDVVQPTALSRLWLVPAGHRDDHALQALAQETGGSPFEQFKGQYDFVILDAGPVLAVADTLLQSQYADGVLLAVRAGISRLPDVHAARQRLATLGVPLLGAVVIGERGD